MPRRTERSRKRKYDYMMDRAERRSMRGERTRDRYYPMDYSHSRSERSGRYVSTMGRDRRYHEEPYMEREQYREPNRVYDYNYDMRYDYRRGRDYSEEDYDKEYEEDLKDWIKDLKKDDRYGLSMEQVIAKAREMGVNFEDYDETEFYAIYLMHVSDYPFIANEPHTYLAMAKAWLDDKDLEIDPSEKVCKYMYEIVMADE